MYLSRVDGADVHILSKSKHANYQLLFQRQINIHRKTNGKIEHRFREHIDFKSKSIG